MIPRSERSIVIRRRDGFAGEHHLIVARGMVAAAQRHRLTSSLFATAAGYFPKAAGHFVERSQGVDETIIILCWAGRGWFELGGHRQTVTAGEVVFIPSHTPHAYGADDDDPWSIIWAHAGGRDLALFEKELGITGQKRLMQVSADALEGIDFHRVYRVLEEGDTLPHLIASSSALRMVLAEILRNQVAPRSSRDADGDGVAKAEAWMRENIARRISLADLSRHAGMSSSHFSTVFRQRMSYSPMEYFVRLKIQLACRLLDSRSVRLKEVAAAIGYPDQYYFSRLFRQVTGMPPRAYRARSRG